ncbi:unnamed protein product [Paramecium sonneborni]|uniref:Uncharacterized protein n=1 Tax=Paramecium sonneborni TaxID=65129 RepID=A0A8S1R5Q5_9CILI|nr:unnamed protein product [Paramecium sonneborni]
MKNKVKQRMEDEALKRIRQSELIVNSIVWMNKNLFKKYCQSQNYYYTRDVNEILGDASSKAVVRFKDWVGYDDDDEYLKRYYYGDEYPQKIQLLSEYYKFHTDIARIFMEPIATLLNKYFDKKRKYEYYRIAHLIEEENKNNPNRPPKGIVGERPSPANSQETQKEQESPDTIKRIRNIQILKDLSWLNQSTQIHKKKNDISCTLQEICKQLGNVALEQSSLLISSGKGDEIKLEQFLAYLNQQTLKTQRDKIQQVQKQTIKINQPHNEQLIQTLIQKQYDETKQRFGSQHSKQNIDLAQQMNKIQRDINVNLIKNQVDTFLKNKQSNDYMQSHTKVDQNDKQIPNIKSKTIVQDQPKISNQLFLTNLRKNFQTNPQIPNQQNQNPVLSPTSNNNKQKTQTTNQITIGKLNLKQISKLYIEEDQTEQELKWKNGSQTHRPISGTKKFFSNRNSPTVSRGAAQQEQRNNQIKQTSGQVSTYSQISQQQSQKNIKGTGSSTNRKVTQPNIHIRYTSNQDKIININININDNLQNQKLKQTKHKKNQSEGKAIHLNSPLIENPQDFVCLTDRAGQGEFLFKNSIAASCQNSPKTQKLKRVGSGLSTIKNSGSTKNSFIQQMVTQISKQQQKQDFFSSQFRKPN